MKKAKGNPNIHKTRVPKDAQVVEFRPVDFINLGLTYGKPHPNWERFVKMYPRMQAHENDAVYALPDRLINAIVKQVPAFFSTEELRFERDLAQLAGAGFFLKSPFGYPGLPRPTLSPEETERCRKLDERHVAAAASIRNLLDEGMRESGATAADIAEHRKSQLAEKSNVEIRQRGYVGWLVTDPIFRHHRDGFRNKWESVIRNIGGFPSLPMSLMGENPQPPDPEYQDFYNDYKALCITWGLDGFATWDLPQPMRPGLGDPSLYHLPSIQAGGVIAFIPWYLLRDKDIKLDELVRRIRLAKGPEHLKDWLDHKPKGWGHDRLGVMLDIYIYIELCLKSRYEERLKRNLERLDRAVGYFLLGSPSKDAGVEQESENVRKIRQAMNRRLRICAASTAENVPQIDQEPVAETPEK